MEDFKEKYRKETREYVHFIETESGRRLYDESYVDWLEQQLKNCNLQNVSNRRELLMAFYKYMIEQVGAYRINTINPQNAADSFIKRHL